MQDKEWYQSKTIWTGVAMVIVGVVGGWGFDLDVTVVESVLMGLLGIFLRQGIGNTK